MARWRDGGVVGGLEVELAPLGCGLAAARGLARRLRLVDAARDLHLRAEHGGITVRGRKRRKT